MGGGSFVFMSEILDILIESLIDCAKLLPFLFLTVLLMEYIEHRAGERFLSSMQKAGRFGPAIGALLGCVPQCGFSAACAQLYNGGLVTAGTLVAVFLSTSDEAVPVLLSNPSGWKTVLFLLLTKLVIALLAGFLVDFIWKVSKQKEEYLEHCKPHICESDEKMKNIFIAALKRTAEIFLYLLLFTVLIGLVIYFVGEERLASLLLPGPVQPILAALVGLIPNCAASVLLTQLYTKEMISFGAVIAGLCSSAGIGMLVLLKGKRGGKVKAMVIGITFLVAVISGLLLQLVS